MKNQYPTIYEHATGSTGTVTKLSDMVTNFDPTRRYTSFILRLKNETATTTFFVGGSDVTTTNKKGIPGSGDSGAFGAVTETLDVQVRGHIGIKLDEYYVAHPTNQEFVLIVY